MATRVYYYADFTFLLNLHILITYFGKFIPPRKEGYLHNLIWCRLSFYEMIKKETEKEKEKEKDVDETLRKFYFEVYKHIIKNRELLSELFVHGINCSVFNEYLTKPVMPKKELMTVMQELGLNETMILEKHLKQNDLKKYKEINIGMRLALKGYLYLSTSNLLNSWDKKLLEEVWERIYEAYRKNLWEWYVKYYSVKFRVSKDLKTQKQTLEWRCAALYEYIEPFKRKADRSRTEDIPKLDIYKMIADIVNHSKEYGILEARQVKWYIENYNKIKT